MKIRVLTSLGTFSCTKTWHVLIQNGACDSLEALLLDEFGWDGKPTRLTSERARTSVGLSQAIFCNHETTVSTLPNRHET
jgi:hypothetical protein